jgi:hypothetical protein
VVAAARQLALSSGAGAAPATPLPPLFLLLFSGLYLFGIPYVVRVRSEPRVGAHERMP